MLSSLILSCSEDTDYHTLTIEAYPEDVADVFGDGNYEAGEVVEISAIILDDEHELVNWINAAGDFVAEEIDFEYTMSDRSDTLTANFTIRHVIEGDGVTDMEGNDYKTIVLGSQEWTAENLRVTRYNNGDDIPTDLNHEDWQNTSEGAFTIFDPGHDDADGINSNAEMVAAYGKLYNWHAISDERGICPDGWKVPEKSDWEALFEAIEDEFGIHNANEIDGLGNALKSSYQVGHPWGADYAADAHPRWNEHMVHYGRDVFGFSATPAGYRDHDGTFILLGYPAFFWASTERDDAYAYYYYINTNMGNVNENNRHKELGLAIRCIRE